MLLPEIQSKKDFIKYKNFCIEFLFDEEYLQTKIEGKGLVLKPGVTVESFNGIEINKTATQELYFNTIDNSSKAFFAEKVVPTLPDEAFKNFIPLFDIINKILEK